MKRCPDCDQVRDLTDFYRNRSRPDGRHGVCRWCHADRFAAWEKANRQRRTDQRRARRAAARGAA